MRSSFSKMCIRCQQDNTLIVDKENSRIKCTNPNCNFELPVDKDTANLFPDAVTPLDEFLSQFSSQKELISQRFQGISYEPDEGERKALFWGSSIVSSIIIIGFLIVANVYWRIPWQTLTFGSLFIALVISRIADTLSTLFILGIGGIEANPLSDPHDISNLLKGHGFRILIISLFAYCLGLKNPWLGNGLLLWMTMMSFRAAFSNISQIFHFIFLPRSPEDIKVLFYINVVICSFIICGAAYYILPRFLP